MQSTHLDDKVPVQTSATDANARLLELIFMPAADTTADEDEGETNSRAQRLVAFDEVDENPTSSEQK